MASLSEQERAEIRRFLGYPSWENLALAWGVSFPTAIAPGYYINDALDRLSDEGNEMVRADLHQCKAVEAQLRDCINRMKATAVGEIKLNPEESTMLRGELERWKEQLANNFNAILNPFRIANGGSRNGVCVG